MRATALAVDDRHAGAAPPHLSTDYLNRYGEALMLLEMAPADPCIVEDLRSWQPVGYRAHFETSQLRCASSAMSAYDGLDTARRRSFEQLCLTMNRLIATVTALLGDLREGQDSSDIVAVASEALRELIGRATQFINANGAVDLGIIERRLLQDEIDALLVAG